MQCAALENRILCAEEAAAFIKPGMIIGMSGFSTGAPKAIPLELAKPGKFHDLTVIQGAGRGMLTELAQSDAVSRYIAFQWCREMRDMINAGKIAFSDVHLGQLSDKLRAGVFGKVDCAVIACSGIREDGGIIPSLSLGINDALLECAEKVLLEINLAVPTAITGIHDVGGSALCPLGGILERRGEAVLRCDPEKIAGIVITQAEEPEIDIRDTDAVCRGIAKQVRALLDGELAAKRLPAEFTLQAGVGGVANAVLREFSEGGHKNLKMFTEVLADGALGLIAAGVISEASTTALDLSLKGLAAFFANAAFYKEHIVLRPLGTSNSASQITAMGLVAINTALEADIYGNINSTHVLGVDMLNGIGGSNDFCRSAKLSVFITPATAKNGDISCIVPMVPHVDSSEHDTDIIATEYGYADLRGKSPKERARAIIENCAHPDYRAPLLDYFSSASALCGPCQTPHDLSKALSWHSRFLKTGTMKQA
jgi:succinyl-CoA:acetate CoA-transferase